MRKQKRKGPAPTGPKHITFYLESLKELYGDQPAEATIGGLLPKSRDSSIGAVEAPKEAAR